MLFLGAFVVLLIATVPLASMRRWWRGDSRAVAGSTAMSRGDS
ncbi:MAG: hypothetical protein QM811_01255 [Pirellulales bacterium]